MPTFPLSSLPPPPAVQHHLPAINPSPAHSHNQSLHHHQSKTQVINHASNPQSQMLDQTSLEAKYNRLKRKYFDMEGRMRTERSEKEEALDHVMRMTAERRAMLGRISELEGVQSPNDNDARHSSALPTMLQVAEPSDATLAVLKQTLALDYREEDPGLPRRRSLHASPQKRFLGPDDKGWIGGYTIQAPQVASTSSSAPSASSSKVAGKKRPSKSASRKQEPSIDGTTVVPSGSTRQKTKPSHALSEAVPEKSGASDVMGPPPIPQEYNATVEISSPISPSNSTSAINEIRPIPTPRPSSIQRSTKPKRLKAHTVTAKTFSVPMIPRDPKTSKPILPLNVGIMTVLNLGEVCMREHFHTERYIFPIGFEVTRRYLSTKNPSGDVTYHCKIIEGMGGPIFQIRAPDIDHVVQAGTATGAWAGIVKTANSIRDRQHSNSVSGPDYFGLGQNTIKHLIQGLPHASTLRDYVWQNYLEGGPMGGRHAAVMPALPDETAELSVARYSGQESMDVDGEDGDFDYTRQDTMERDMDGRQPPVDEDAEMEARSGSTSEVQAVDRMSAKSDEAMSPHTRKVPSRMASLLNNDGDGDNIVASDDVAEGQLRAPQRSPQPLTSPAASVARDSEERRILPVPLPLA